MTVQEIHRNLLEVLVKAAEAHAGTIRPDASTIMEPTRHQMAIGKTQAQVVTAKLACAAAGIHEEQVRLVVDIAMSRG